MLLLHAVPHAVPIWHPHPVLVSYSICSLSASQTVLLGE